VVEPLSGLHKDEVRELGERLGLPHELVWRQPFPGPGLAIRVICAGKPYKTADFADMARHLKQLDGGGVFCSLLPIKTVGVQGDGRSYSYLAGLSGKPDWNKLIELAREIPKTVHGINRVAYIFGEPVRGAVQEITPTYLTSDVLGQLRAADEVVTKVMLKYNLMQTLRQVPVISFPVHFGQPGKRSIAIRTFITNDWMTGVPAIPGVDFSPEALGEMIEGILRVPGVARVAYDLTSKPPGTTEWE
jgi:GMP synthase (glutamine-hydrolysing)